MEETRSRGGMFNFLRMLVLSFRHLKRNDPLRMAGATAFFATFAIPPLIIILFQVISLVLSRKLAGSELMSALSDTLGPDAATQVRRTTNGIRILLHSWYVAIPGFLFMLFIATTLFSVIKNTLDDLWRIKVKDKAGWLFILGLRAKSLLVILATGLLFLAGILLDGCEILVRDNFAKIYPGGIKFFSSILNEITGLLVVSLWFVVLFRYLADAKPSWKAAIAGGILTGVLFSIGKSILSILMRNSNIPSLYGTSASMVLMLLFVFYSSMILYFGASFVKIYSDKNGMLIEPIGTAYSYRLEKLE